MTDKVLTNEHGTAWYVNVVDVADLPDLLRQTVAGWTDTDCELKLIGDRIDSHFVPLVADDHEQLEARKELLRSGFNGVARTVRVKSRRGGRHDDAVAATDGGESGD